jgi:hypothetical protein
VLTARAHEMSHSRRLATYRVDVTNPAGASISCFTGTVFLDGGANEHSEPGVDG